MLALIMSSASLDEVMGPLLAAGSTLAISADIWAESDCA
jgi:hypothetical protein